MPGKEEGDRCVGGSGDCGFMTRVGCVGGALDYGVDVKCGFLPVVSLLRKNVVGTEKSLRLARDTLQIGGASIEPGRKC